MASWSRVRTDTENSEHMPTLQSALTKVPGVFICLSVCHSVLQGQSDHRVPCKKEAGHCSSRPSHSERQEEKPSSQGVSTPIHAKVGVGRPPELSREEFWGASRVGV